MMSLYLNKELGLLKEAMRMLLEQVYLIFIYILLSELAIVTVVTIALFVALIVTVRKLDNKKNTPLSGQQRCAFNF